MFNWEWRYKKFWIDFFSSDQFSGIAFRIGREEDIAYIHIQIWLMVLTIDFDL